MNIRRWFRSLEPRAMDMLNGPIGERIRPWVDQHDVLNFGRNSLAKGIAFGLLCGLLPLGPIQMGATVLMCVRWRGNALAGIVTTLYSNVLTIVPLYMLAHQIGEWVLMTPHVAPDVTALNASTGGLSSSVDWVFSMGWPLVVGIPVLGAVLAVLGFALVQLLWLWPVYLRMQRKRARKV